MMRELSQNSFFEPRSDIESNDALVVRTDFFNKMLMCKVIVVLGTIILFTLLFVYLF